MYFPLGALLIVNVCSNPPLRDLESDRQHVLATYYSPQLIEQWRGDAKRIGQHFPVDIFNTCQYGTFFLTGEVQLSDVFDARVTSNRQGFVDFAGSKNLILPTEPCEGYARYARAATRFLDYFGYNSVLYFPDEFHPLFTTEKDCWLFIYEPVKNPNPDGIHYSLNSTNRRIAVHGGADMEQAPDASYCLFYIPNGGYKSYQYLDTYPTSGYQDSAHVHMYTIPKVTSEQIARRDSANHVASPFSNRQITIGRWAPADRAYNEMENGFSFTAMDSVYTWSAMGFYGIPLDSSIWQNHLSPACPPSFWRE